jgi:hypothetical protein
MITSIVIGVALTILSIVFRLTHDYDHWSDCWLESDTVNYRYLDIFFFILYYLDEILKVSIFFLFIYVEFICLFRYFYFDIFSIEVKCHPQQLFSH